MKRKILILIVAVVGLVSLGGCQQRTKGAQPAVTQQKSTPKNGSNSANKQNSRKIIVDLNGHRLKAHLNQSSAARAFYQELPRTLSFRDYAGLPEKVADLNHTLPTTGMPKGHAGTKGAIGYWSPEQRIVFYWGTESYYEGIHIIGHFDSQHYRKVIKNMKNGTNVRLSRAN